MTNTASSSYLNNLQLLSTPLGEYPSNQLVKDKSDHTKGAGMEKILLPIKTEGPKLFTVGGLQPFGRSGALLNNTMSCPTIIISNQASNKIDIWVHGDSNISLVILDSRTEVQR